MELTKRAQRNNILKSTLERINRLVLDNQGQQFTIVEKFETHRVSYSKICGIWTTNIVERLDSGRPKEIDRYNLHWPAYKELPSGIFVTSQYDTLSDGRKREYKKATLVKGYIVTITVSADYSRNYYIQNYSKEGFPFRDHLLDSRRDVLESICANNYFMKNGFCVYKDAIFNDNVGECITSSVYFSNYGFSSLTNIAQYYGFALALVEVLKYNHPNIGEAVISCSKYYDNDCITVSFVQNTAVNLKSW